VVKTPVIQGGSMQVDQFETNQSLVFDVDDVMGKGMLSENFDEDLEDSSDHFDEIQLLSQQNEAFKKEQVLKKM
jgi:hypothetical protein